MRFCRVLPVPEGFFALRVGAEADPSRMHVEMSLPEGGQLFRLKIKQKPHFAVAVRAVELLLDLWSVLCPPASSWALLKAVLRLCSLGCEGQKLCGALSGLCTPSEGAGEPPWGCVGAGLGEQHWQHPRMHGAWSPWLCSDGYLASASLLRECS